MPEPAELQDAFLSIPINRYFQLRLLERGAARTVVSAEIRPEYGQEHGVVHGAIVTAVADTAAVWLFHPDLGADQTMASIEFKVNFLAPAFLNQGPLLAEAALVRRGRRVGVAQTDVRQNGERVACGLFTYMFFQRGQT